jgi:asparagine synthase (glutamine-hydrolysing)
VLGADGIRELLSVVKTPGHAAYQGMAELRPGTVLRLSRNGVTSRRYWQLEAIEHADDVGTTVATVRELLEDIIDRQLISDVPLCTLLSGGLDSSAVTALAARKLAAHGGRPVRSFAVDFAGYADNFRADEMRATPDAPYARQLAGHVTAEHASVVLSPAELIDRGNRAAVVRASDYPLGGNMITSQYLLFAGIRRHSTVALSGESADEVFGGYHWLFGDSVTAGTFPWLAFPGRARGHETTGAVTPFTDEVLAILDVEQYQRDMYQAAIAEVPHTGTTDPVERRMRQACYLHLTRWVQFLLDRKDRMSMANGLEVRVPFCDHRLVQYVFNTPWSFKTFDGREKSLLRAAVSDLLPEAILRRKKAPFPAAQDPAYARALLDDLGKLVADGTSAVLGLLDTDRTQRLLGHDASAMGTPARSTIETVLAMDDWLSATGARIDLSA